MDTHRIEILDGADDDHVAVTIAQQLQLIFFPSHDALLDEHFMGRRGVETAGKGSIEFFFCIYKASARSAQRKRRTYHQREPDLLGDFFSFQEAAGSSSL